MAHPIRIAILTGAVMVAIGLALSVIGLQIGLIKSINWLAAALLGSGAAVFAFIRAASQTGHAVRACVRLAMTPKMRAATNRRHSAN